MCKRLAAALQQLVARALVQPRHVSCCRSVATSAVVRRSRGGTAELFARSFERTATMNLLITPPAARRLSAVAIAAALAAFAGIAGAQTKAPGFATSGSGGVLY